MHSTTGQARVFVGQAGVRGGILRYARAFDLVEVAADPGRHPRRATLVDWRKSVPAEFVFSVVVPVELAALEAGAKSVELTAHAAGVVSALSATWWALRTPPSVTPSPRSVRALAALVSELRVTCARIAWEPRGVWGEEEALRTSLSLGVHLVRDLAREDGLSDDPVVYTRLRALGEGARVGPVAAERVAERLAHASEAYVVVEGDGAQRARRTLRELLGAAETGEAAEDDEEDSELLEEEDQASQGSGPNEDE